MKVEIEIKIGFNIKAWKKVQKLRVKKILLLVNTFDRLLTNLWFVEFIKKFSIWIIIKAKLW